MIMNRKEFAREMKELEAKYGGDKEVLHGAGDDLMCEMLKALGYGEGVEIFEKWDKWYA